MHGDLLRRTRDVIASCSCEHGCPTCVGPVGNTGPLAKLVALRILDRLGQVTLATAASSEAELGAGMSVGAVIDPPPAESLAELPPF
jgi:ATP-dependent helicase YprA (DUF1998 family)